MKLKINGVILVRKYYYVSEKEITKADSTLSNFIIFEQATSSEREQFLKEYALPNDVFSFFDMPAIAPRIEYLKNTRLGDTMIFVVANISEHPENLSVEKRLESHTFILGNNQLFWIINEGSSNLDEEFFDTILDSNITFENIIMSVGLLTYKHFTRELFKQKENIDYLDEQTEHRTSNEILINVTSTEKNMVMLEHTLDMQELAFSRLLEDRDFLERLDDEELTHDIKWYNRQVNKLVHLYRDLLDAVSSLYSDVMSNNLNSLMKFLNSISLILASSGLIAELWGMNTGGLPGESHNFGTFIMFSISFIAGLSMYLYLNRKKFFDD